MPRFGFNYEPRLFRSRRQSLLVDNQSSVAFSPDSIATIGLWLDASDSATINLTGSVVNQWNDKSGNSRHFTGSGASRPSLVSGVYNGLDCIRFDGVDDVLVLPSDSLGRNKSGYTVFGVYKFNAFPTSQKVVFWVVTSVNTARMLLDAGVTSNRDRWAARRLDAGSPAVVTGVNIVSTSSLSLRDFNFDCSDGTIDAYLDGFLEGSNSIGGSGNSTDGDTNGTFIGANYIANTSYWSGDACEFLVYESVLSSGDINSVRSYLNAKWGL